MNSDPPAHIKAGLEIHQQLETEKLFCSCPSVLSEQVSGLVLRKLRVSVSEMGEVDEAARLQTAKNESFEYEITPNSCLVELDEEPPHAVNMEAIRVGLEMALLLHSAPVDEVHFMRKVVVDGSNTAGFQRTALLSMGGWLDVGGRRVGIQSICCEEDACRKMERKGDTVTYRLDRLGVPLLEISTDPDIDSPEMLKAVARKIGMLLRATGKVKRGIGTIREDLNISVRGGSRVEIKGVQELDMLPAIAENEAARQRRLLDASGRLAERKHAIEHGWKDMTALLSSSQSTVIRRSLSAGSIIGGMILPGYAGLLSSGGQSVIGTEIAQRLRAIGIHGILHSDELPAYGVTEEEKTRVSNELGARSGDAFVLCAAPLSRMDEAMAAVVTRALQAAIGVPEETRDAKEDGSTAYSRPLPGRARMYPETDVLPIRVDRKLLEGIASGLPEPFEEQAVKIEKEFNLHRQQAVQIAEEGYGKLFTDLSSRYGNPAVLARILLNNIPEAEREAGTSFGDLSVLEGVMARLRDGAFAKEAVPGLLVCMLRGRGLDECISALGIGGMTREEAAGIIARIVNEHSDLVRERGEASVGPLMGIAMKELRGKIDGRDINALLASEVRRVISSRDA